MGNPVSSLRKKLDHANAEEEKKQERLNILEKMVDNHLENAKASILNGERGDQEIHTGTVVEFNKQVNIKLSSKESDDLDKAIKEFFGGNILGGFEQLVKLSVQSILGNSSMGEHEGSSMFIQWSDNAVIRMDAYFYRWNFSSKEIIQDVEGAVGVIVMSRVIDLTKTDVQVLTWAISRQARFLGTPQAASQMISEAVSVIQKVTALQEKVKSKEDEDHNRGKGQVTD